MFGSFIERYENKKKLKIKVPEGTKIIKDEAFCYYEYDKSAKIPYGVEEIGAVAFLYCSALT